MPSQIFVCVCVQNVVWQGEDNILEMQRVFSLLLTFCRKHQVALRRDEQRLLGRDRKSNIEEKAQRECVCERDTGK